MVEEDLCHLCLFTDGDPSSDGPEVHVLASLHTSTVYHNSTVS